MLDSMGVAKVIVVDEVKMDAAVGIVVRPRIAPGEGYEFIYRMASGVRWNPERRAFVVFEPKEMSAAWWFRQIVTAVQSEYGHRLELRQETRWTDIPQEVRLEMESEHAV